MSNADRIDDLYLGVEVAADFLSTLIDYDDFIKLSTQDRMKLLCEQGAMFIAFLSSAILKIDAPIDAQIGMLDLITGRAKTFILYNAEKQK